MGKRAFATHRVQIGMGKNRTYVYVRIAGEAGMKNGQQYYNVIVAADEKSGIQSLPAIPKSRLEVLGKERYILRYMKEEEELLTVREAANALRVHGATVRQWILNGTLEAMILPRGECQNSYLIKRSVIDAILEGKSKDANG